MTVQAKICGITTLDAARTAIAGGASWLGFIHFGKSPRHLDLAATAALMQAIRHDSVNIPLVAVVVDPDDALLTGLTDTVKPDLIQLHGKETPQRVDDIRHRLNIPVIKALSIAEAADLTHADDYVAADYLMFDAKAPAGADMPGGLGLSFDWSLMRGYSGAKPWFLAGGLTPDNVAEAVRISGARRVDVSSGVESAPGIKDPQRISDFLNAVKAL